MECVREETLFEKKNAIINLYSKYNDPLYGYPKKVTEEIASIRDDIEKMKTIWTADNGEKAIRNLSSLLDDIETKFIDLNTLVSVSNDDISWQNNHIKTYDKPLTK